MEKIIADALNNSLSYQQYRTLVSELIADGKSTGNTQSDDLLHYSQLNETRMNRLEKTIKITEEVQSQLENVETEMIWLLISEGWCGDAAQLLPIIHKMAEVSDKIDLKIVLRDENEALMDAFLTNGGKAIPKLIVLDAKTKKVLGDWGPRPEDARKLIADYKAAHGVVDETAKIELQKWYLNDKGVSTQNEIVALISSAVLL